MRGTNILLALIAGLLAAIVIVLIRADLGRAPAGWRGEVPDSGREPERRAAAQHDIPDSLTRSVESLRASVERLNGALEEWKAMADSRPRSGGEVQLVDRVAVDARPGAWRAKSELEAAVKAPPDAARRKALDDMRADDDVVVNRRHWFMTMEEVIQRYGPPDEIVPDAGGHLLLQYHTELADFNLQFYDGRLLRFDWSVK